MFQVEFAVLVLCVKFFDSQCSSQDEKQVMKGFHLRFPAAINPPILYAEKGPNGSAVFKGVHVHLANYLAQSLNITYSFVPVNASLVSQQGNNQVFIDMLLKERIDMICFPMSPSWTRKSFMDFSYPLNFDAYKILYPWPQQASRLLAPVRPYQQTVWILILMSLLATVLCLVLVYGYDAYSNTQRSFLKRFARVSINIIAVSLGQGDLLPSRNHSFRIAAAAWCLMMVVLINSYSSTLTSFLTLPVYEKPVNSLEDLIDRPDIHLLVPTDSVLLQTLTNAKDGPYKAIGDAIRKRPENIYKSVEEGLKRLFSGRNAYTSNVFFTEYLLAEDYKKAKTCRYTVSKSLSYSSPQTYGLPKNGPYNQIFNIQFMRLWEYGFSKRWLDMYRGRFEQCIVRPQSPRMAALKLQDLYSAFIILFLGTGLGLLVFLYQNILSLTRKILVQRASGHGTSS